MDTSEPVLDFDVFSESAKALVELVLGDWQTDNFRQNLVDFNTLSKENEELKLRVASLEEAATYKSKYENLQIQFRTVAAERDTLSARSLDYDKVVADFDRLKKSYQRLKVDNTTLQNELDGIKSSIKSTTALEQIYQLFKAHMDKHGIDIRRIPTRMFIQFILDEPNHRGSSYSFYRKSADKWERIP